MAATALIAAGAAIGSSATNSALGNLGTKKAQKRAYQYNEMAADNAYDRQINYWNKTFADTTAYEDPTAKYGREIAGLKANGLSPGLFYSGAGGSSTPATGESSAPQGGGVGAPSGSSPNLDLASSISIAQNLRESRSRERLNDSTSAKTDAETGNVSAQHALLVSQADANLALAHNTRARTEGEVLANLLAEETLPINIEQARVNLAQQTELLTSYIEQAKQSVLSTRFASDTYDDRVRLVELDIAAKTAGIILDQARARATLSGANLTDAQLVGQLATNQALPPLLLQQLKNLGATGDLLGAQTRLSNRQDAFLDVRTRHTQKSINWFDANAVSGIINSSLNSISGFF